MKTSSARKKHQTRLLSEAIRNFVMRYKGWLEDALRLEKLSLPQLRLLCVVEESEGQSSAAIARNLGVTPQTLQTMMERATREGWIVRSHSVTNARALTATLTPRGKSVLERGKELTARFERAVWAGTDGADLERCIALLNLGIAKMIDISPNVRAEAQS